MNTQGHRKAFDEKGLVDHNPGNGAKDKPADMFFADASFGGRKHPEDPQQEGADPYTDHIEAERADKPLRDILNGAEIDAKQQVG